MFVISQDVSERLTHEEDAHVQIAQIKKKLEMDVNTLKKEVEDLELTIQKVSLFGEKIR